MKTEQIRKKFLTFFEKHKHTIIESSSLWPQDDPSVLLTTAGMQQLKPYFMGEKDPETDFHARRLASVQRCFRTSDIDSVGDSTHSTFFEMLGNFSLNDYFKEEAITLAWNFLTKRLKLDANRLWVTYFSGDGGIAADTETAKLWEQYLPAQRIIASGRADNWWGPTGDSGPCGPSSEIHYDIGGPDASTPDDVPNSGSDRFIEIWNLVFTEYHMSTSGKLKQLETKNIDTGMGLERLAMILQKKRALGDIDVNASIISVVTSDEHFGSTTPAEDIWRSRIVADHIKGAVFLLADGIVFSNKEQGYILRRIFRRALDQYLQPHYDIGKLVDAVIDVYGSHYPIIQQKRGEIVQHMETELASYQKVLELDVDEVVKKISHQGFGKEMESHGTPSTRSISAHDAFVLYSTYGLSSDRLKRKGYAFDDEEFQKLVAKHQEQSRAASQSKFGGHGLNSSELSEEDRQKMTRLHTATHLLHQALRQVLGEHVRQQGSDINPERLRFDFEHPAKMTDDQIQAVEDLVNEQIAKDLPVTKKQMPYDEAMQSGALAFFKEKYGEMVTVYSIGDFSKELCGGPHVEHTGELGTFKIQSEKSSSAAIRRIKATLS